MADQKDIVPLRGVLEQLGELDERAWLYLSATERWQLDSGAAVLVSEEVPPELEDDPDAGVPEFAKTNGLMQVLQVSTVKEIVENVRLQREHPEPETLLRALLYYFDHDAFVEL